MIQKIIPVNQPIKESVSLPGSKSMVNRALIMASLAKGESLLSNMLFSDDTIACLNALEALGVQMQINRDKQQVSIFGGDNKFSHHDAQIYCHDSGTVTRFMLPVCAAIAGNYHFSASKRMSERPIGSLLEVLALQGAKFSFEKVANHMPLLLHSSGLKGGGISIPTNQSSQFLSGLLMAAPLAASDISLTAKAKKKLTYVEMTTKMQQVFGIDVVKQNETYFIKSGQYYKGCNYTIEPDISTASYFAAMAALTNGEVFINYVNKDTLQGDLAFLNVLEKMGCSIIYNDQGVIVKGAEKLTGVDVNMSSFSDTFMTLAAIASFAETKTTITGIAHTRLQESDRIEAISTQLRILGARVETTNDAIIIYPEKLHGGIVSGCGDHRVAMSLSLVGLRIEGVEIQDSECVSKTLPDYFERLNQICNL